MACNIALIAVVISGTRNGYLVASFITYLGAAVTTAAICYPLCCKFVDNSDIIQENSIQDVVFSRDIID